LHRLPRTARGRHGEGMPKLSHAGTRDRPHWAPSMHELPRGPHRIDEQGVVRELPHRRSAVSACKGGDGLFDLPSPSWAEWRGYRPGVHDVSSAERTAGPAPESAPSGLPALSRRAWRRAQRRALGVSDLSRRPQDSLPRRPLRELSPFPERGQGRQGTVNVTVPSACRSGRTNVRLSGAMSSWHALHTGFRAP